MQEITKLFANEPLTKTLSLFLMNPAQEFFQRSIAVQTKKALIQVQRSLKMLEAIGLIASRKLGRMVFYRAVPTHPAFADLKNLFIKTISLGDTLRSALKEHSKHIEFAWVYGSVAKGKEQLESDIDLVIISDLTLRELSQIVSPLVDSLQRELSPLFLTPETLLKRYREQDHFVTELIEGEKIWIIGDDHQFRRFTKSGSVKKT